LLASWNKSGYCTKHHDQSARVDPRFCQEPECGKRLRSDSPDTLCVKHRLEKLAKQQQACKECSKPLRQDNSSGYCEQHFYLSRSNFNWDKCKEPGCINRVHPSRNLHGWCRLHRFKANGERGVCKVKECGAALRSDNKCGFCKLHRLLKDRAEPKFCKKDKCGKILGLSNKSGLCTYHRNQSKAQENPEAGRQRMQVHRARQQQKLAKADRILAEQQPDPRIILAICLEREGLEGYSLANPLFFDVIRPKPSDQRKARQDRRKKLYKRHSEELERERQRLASVPENELPTVKERARLQIKQQPPEPK